MRNRFLYMKFLGLLLVLVGFSYSITSFTNFFSYIFDFKIYVESLNIYVMSIGLIIPIIVFIYGVYFYFYTDFNITRISNLIFGTNIFLFIISVLMIIFKSINYYSFPLFQIFEFIHTSFSYCMLVLASMGIYGCFKFKF